MNKGGRIVLGLMLATVFVILAFALAPAIKETVDEARNTTTDTRIGLDCDNSSITDEAKAACVVTDLSLPYFIAVVIGLAGMIIGASIVFGDG